MNRQPFSPITGADILRFAPGEIARSDQYDPGDFILTHGSGIFNYLIRFGQHLRFRGEDAKYCWWNHAAMIVSAAGDLIEALDAGSDKRTCQNILQPSIT
jgi:hypothetical protein